MVFEERGFFCRVLEHFRCQIVTSRKTERCGFSEQESVTVNGGHLCSASFDFLENLTS